MKISIDWDDVLYDLQTILIEETNKIYNTDIVFKNEINSWNFYDQYPKVKEVFHDFDKYSTGLLINGAGYFMADLEQFYEIENLQIVTHTHFKDTSKKDTMIKDLLAKYIDVDKLKIIHTGYDKTSSTKDNILIDDAIHNNIDHIKVNQMPSILVDFGYGWNQDKIEDEYTQIYREKTYNDIVDRLFVLEF